MSVVLSGLTLHDFPSRVSAKSFATKLKTTIVKNNRYKIEIQAINFNFFVHCISDKCDNQKKNAKKMFRRNFHGTSVRRSEYSLLEKFLGEQTCD